MTKWERLNDPEAAEIYIASLEAVNLCYEAMLRGCWRVVHNSTFAVVMGVNDREIAQGETPAEALDAAIKKLDGK